MEYEYELESLYDDDSMAIPDSQLAEAAALSSNNQADQATTNERFGAPPLQGELGRSANNDAVSVASSRAAVTFRCLQLSGEVTRTRGDGEGYMPQRDFGASPDERGTPMLMPSTPALEDAAITVLATGTPLRPNMQSETSQIELFETPKTTHNVVIPQTDLRADIDGVSCCDVTDLLL
eukprot:Opistho-2@53902